MTPSSPPPPHAAWDSASLDAPIAELTSLRKTLLAAELRSAASIQAAALARRQSATNLTHYLALRQVDLRPLQERLARLGLS